MCVSVSLHNFIFTAAPVHEPPPTPAPSRNSTMIDISDPRPGSVMRVSDAARSSHSRTSSLDYRPAHSRSSSADMRLHSRLPTHSRNSSVDLRHSRNSSTDFNGRLGRIDAGITSLYGNSSKCLQQPEQCARNYLLMCILKQNQQLSTIILF